MSGYVSNDLMVEIFERLPLKSIIRLRSLSKYWHSRIASPEFISNHRLRSSKNPHKVIIRHVIHCGKYKFKSIYTLHTGDQLPLDSGPGYMGTPGVEFPYPCCAAEVVGSCNGILCLRNREISLWNVSIRRALIMPSLKSYANVAFGFGFDPMTDDYKIVAVSYSRYHKRDTRIYSLKTDSWSAIPPPSALSTDSYDVKWNACLLNGILHWVVYDDLTTQPSQSLFILTFNLSSHVFGRIALPKPWRIRQLTTINGCLAAVSTKGNNTWLIQTMKEYNRTESWSVPFEFKKEGCDLIRVFQPVTNGDLLAYSDGSKVYYPRTMSLTEVAKFGPDCFKLDMETYVESLELLDKERARACGETIFSWRKKGSRRRIR